MEKEEAKIGIHIQLNQNFEDALLFVANELKKEGFGILTEIDVKATLKEKLDVDFRPYRILGACNPPLAYRALSAAPEVGLLLPCNVTVLEEAEGKVLVSIVDPLSMLGFVNAPELLEVAEEARARLERVAAALSVQSARA